MQINVLGLGNVMFGDEGFGVEAVRLLINNEKLPPQVQVIDGGTQGIYLLGFVEDTDRLLIFDALIPQAYDRQVYVYREHELPEFIYRKLSSHQIGLSELLSLARLHDKYPEEIALIGIPPQKLDMHVGLSPKAQELLPVAVAEGMKVIHSWLEKS